MPQGLLQLELRLPGLRLPDNRRARRPHKAAAVRAVVDKDADSAGALKLPDNGAGKKRCRRCCCAGRR